MEAEARDERHARLRRARWRLRGAWQWPTFVTVTLSDAALLHWLPLAGDGTGWVPALLLAGCLNLIVVAVLGGLGGWALRRRRPDLPKVVADDYAGTAVIVALAGVFLAIGLVHRPAVLDGRQAFGDQSTAVRRWVLANGDAFARAHVDGADTLRLEDDLFRTCVPGEDPNRWLCLIVDTSSSPPLVRRDANRESNTSLNRPGGFR
ncbi:MAG: hypothetical protein H0T43_00895 [Solirubrobacterales bacterium]|nr:hypothetical protein [Solirubrobacterales bacterium]